jgi:acetoacetyl-CoA synthetase
MVAPICRPSGERSGTISTSSPTASGDRLRRPDASDALLPRTRLNYAEHVLRHETKGDPGRPAIRHSSELRPLHETSWKELANHVRTLATALRRLGIRPGDCVVSYMPNIVETAITMLATTAIGATWASAAPEFGAKTVVDRFGQIGPKLIFVADGYRYGGKEFDRSKEIAEIVAQTSTIEKVVWLDYRGDGDRSLIRGVEVLSWGSLLEGPTPDTADFRFERVASDHPLWVLFSSGTTGLPKAIVHGHHGIVVEAYKNAAFHFNLKKDDVLFFYSTTGWMMWNTLMNAVLMDGVAVLFDGHPSQPDPMSLWTLAESAGATAFGTNPTVTQIMRKLGLRPKESCKFEHLESVMLVGSPATPDAFHWVYENVKSDVWVTSQSGGTEFCSGLLGGVPTDPVRAGLIDAPSLGVDAKIFNKDGQPVLNEPGELVIASPMPSMPPKLWGDEDNKRYRDTYFDRWPDVWRHGDSAQINSDLTCQVFGRSDATLNRYGVLGGDLSDARKHGRDRGQPGRLHRASRRRLLHAAVRHARAWRPAR